MPEYRPDKTAETALRKSITATDTDIPVLSTSSLTIDSRKQVGDEFVRCSAFASDPQGQPIMTGCERGVNQEDGGSSPRGWPGGTTVFEVGWTAVEILTELPTATLEDVGREIHVAGEPGEPNRTYVGSLLENGTPYWDEANDATYDTGTLVIASGAITLPGVKPNVSLIKVTVDTEGSAATDDLTTITNTGTVEDGTLLVLRSLTSTRDIVVLETGNITLGSGSGSSYSLSVRPRRLVLIWDALDSEWVEISRSTAGIQFSHNASVITTSMTALDVDAARFDYNHSPVGQVRLSFVPITPVITQRSATSPSIASGSNATTAATCNAGEVCIGGGFTNNSTFSAGVAVQSRRASSTSWEVTWHNAHGSAVTITVYALCMQTPLG